MVRLLSLTFLIAASVLLRAQTTPQIIVLHDSVGTVIDSSEKARFHLFPFWSAKQFDHAEFLMNADSTISIRGTMKDGNVYTIPCTKDEFANYQYQVRYYSGTLPKEARHNNGAVLGEAIGGLVTSVTAFFSVKRIHSH